MNATHTDTCECGPCLVADMNKHLASIGFEGAGGPVTSEEMNTYSERMRYAKPGQRVGRGIVRKVSDKQVKYMIFLFKTRNTSKLVRLPGSESIESMSLAGARDLIDRLLSCPVIENVESSAANLASEKQIAFIGSLISQRECPEGSQEWYDAKKSTITRDAAKSMIERLLALPYKTIAKTESTNVVPDGRYAFEKDGIVKFYRLKTSKAGRQYVSAMASDTEHYIGQAPSIVAEIAKDVAAASKLYGDEFGRCSRCNHGLTDEVSRSYGIGPDCRSKL